MSTKLDIENKTFQKDFSDVLNVFSRSENFSFCRFSDGEVFMMQGKEILLADNGAIVGDQKLPGRYAEEDRKHYNPKEHEFYRQKLEDSLTFRADNYYKGLSCRCCCVGQEGFDWQLNKIGPGDEHNLTWANLMINSNYLDYINKFVPLFKTKRIFSVINNLANISNWGLDFQPEKNFPIGSNCIINDYGVIEEIKNFIRLNNIKDSVFLLSASSLSNMIAHQCYMEYPNNTYIDIGSSLNPFMPGINSRRSYMNQLSTGVIDKRVCIW